MSLSLKRPLLAAVVVCVSSSVWAQANSGVSDERVSLPQAPGSIAGVGQNASVEGNQGSLTYGVDIEVPPGFAGLTPQVALGYASAGGSTVVGTGWSFPTFSIERMTSKGLQKYALTDRFVVDGSQELVEVARSGSTGTYRARFEGGFVRFTWLNAGTGAGGSWKAEFPDGRVGYYGADKAGAPVTAAQVIVPSTSNVFRWHLVLMEDQWGHQMKLTWTKDSSGTPLLERMEYLFEGTTPRHSVRFTYEARTDVISDARAGFDLRLTQRLKDIRIFSGTTTPEQVRRYQLEYEPDATSGAISRLRSVTRLGRGDAVYPVKFSFAYSKTLGGVCDSNCAKPFVNNMGTVSGVDFSTGKASMVDINGDSLPDVVVSDTQGRHSFIYAKLDAEGRASFMSAPVPSARTTGSSPFILGDPKTQLLDVNGDGFVDITQAKAPAVLCNNGSGDWVESTFCVAAAPALPADYDPADDTADGAQQDPRYVRFFDYDNDKRIDWLRTFPGGSSTQVLANTPAGFSAVAVDNLGVAFDESTLQLADMNGDGLQDPVELLVSGGTITVKYRLNLGYGKWTEPPVSLTVSGLNASQAAVTELEDINGDALADLIAVSGNEVALVLNRGSAGFAPVLRITDADLGGGNIPTRQSTTTVTYADMNGNGSSDIVWFQADGSTAYLELFPVRPNLISRIENAVGAVQLISYGSSIFEQDRDTKAGMPWANRVPNASVLVTKVDSFVTLTGTDSGGLHEQLTFRYHSGFYDGLEKQFRGYETVERELNSDMTRDSTEPGLVKLSFDVGKTEPAYAGRTVTQQAYALTSTTPALLREDRTLYGLCEVAEVPATTTPAIKWACNRATTTIYAERDLANARTVRVEREYDGYGNVRRETNAGVTNLGTPESPRDCEACIASGRYGAPCGQMCIGDEYVNEFTYVTPANAGGLWALNKIVRTTQGAVASALNVETVTYYDGPEYVGLAVGQMTKGGISRVARRFGLGAADFIDVIRVKRDASGNALEQLSPNGSPSNMAERRIYTYDPSGLWTTSVEIKLDATKGLRTDRAYDVAFETVSEASNWYATNAGAPVTNPQVSRYRYDDHGRLTKIVEPQDTDAAPSTEIQYVLGNPASKIQNIERSSPTSGQDVITTNCLDGRGRIFQTRVKLDQTRWQVSGFTEFDARGAPARVFQPYVSTSADCDTSAPAEVPFVKTTYDMLGRTLVELEPDGAQRRYVYGPLSKKTYDEDDNDSASPAFDTPTIEVFDGLNRLVRIERSNPAGKTGPGAATTLDYDVYGNLFTVTDPGGHAHVQVYDPLGRMTQLTDVNSGVTRYEYDNAGNLTKKTDARNVVTRMTYDALNRTTAEWNEADEANTKVTWAYDALSGCTDCTNLGGQVAQAEWKNGRDRYGYDAKGNTLFHERTFNGIALAERFTYDGVEREKQAAYPGGLSLDRAYDGAARVTAITGYVNQVQYGDRDLVSKVTFTNGVTTEYGYDQRRRLSSLKTRSADGTAVLDLSYARTLRGDLTRITDNSTRAGRVNHGGIFTSDAWNRLTQASLDTSSSTSEIVSFTYDTLDNLTALTSDQMGSRANVGTLTYDAAKANAVTQAGALSYTYDGAGYVVTRGGTTYTFDHKGRLTSATRDQETQGSFQFGPGYDRVSKTEGGSTTWYVSPNFEVRDGIAVAYVDLGENRVARVQSPSLAASVLSDLAPATGSGTVTPMGDKRIDIADAWLAQGASVGTLQLSGGPTPSSVTALLASSARRLLVDDVTWLHQDHLQSVVASTNADGALIAEQSFFPTGEPRTQTGFVDRYGFTGQEKEASTGLTHFQHRELDTQSGRWMSVDPAFDELSPSQLRSLGQATTAYAYIANNFLNATDPTGLANTPATGGTGGSTSGTASQGSGRGRSNSTTQRQQGAKKSNRAEKAVRITQLVIALASVTLSLVGAGLSYEGSASVGADGTVHLDDTGKAGAVVSVAATSTSSLGSLIGAGYDTSQAFKSKSDQDTSGTATGAVTQSTTASSTSNTPPAASTPPPTGRGSTSSGTGTASPPPPPPRRPRPPPGPPPRANLGAQRPTTPSSSTTGTSPGTSSSTTATTTATSNSGGTP